ncbi:MAG: alpha/beta fold hydrolase, partial [Ruthenibacterium sp.]
MSKVTKDTVRYKSANGTDEIVGYYYTCEEIKPKAVLQISHGMCEYIGRYDAFADYMAQHGYAVCGNDHLGHGETSRGEGGVDGYFADKDGRKYVLQDLHRMNCLASKRFPGLPILLLGHSMGSFFARLYAGTYPETIQGLILSGTGGPNPLGGIGMVLTSLIGKIRGTQHRSQYGVWRVSEKDRQAKHCLRLDFPRQGDCRHVQQGPEMHLHLYGQRISRADGDAEGRQCARVGTKAAQGFAGLSFFRRDGPRGRLRKRRAERLHTDA